MYPSRKSKRKFNQKFNKGDILKVRGSAVVGKVTSISLEMGHCWYTLDKRFGPYSDSELEKA